MSTAKSHKSKQVQTNIAGGPSSTQRAADPASPTLENSLVAILMGTPSDSVSPEERAELLAEVGEVQREMNAPKELRPEKQPWYRPADSKMRPKAIQIVAWRAAGHDDKAIAKKLNTTETTIRNCLYIARKNGWLAEGDVPVDTDIEDELAVSIDRKIVRNISASLDGQMTNYQTHEMTIAAAKGRGIFTERSKTDTTIQATGLVQIQVVKVAGVDVQEQMKAIPADQMGGVAAYLEGEVAE